MHRVSRLPLLGLVFLGLVSCEGGGPSPEDSPPCFYSVDTIVVATLPMTESVPGTLADGDCVLARGSIANRYYVDLQVTAEVTMSVASTDFDAAMYLRDYRDAPFGADDNSGPGSDAQISYGLISNPLDALYIFATSSGKNVTGAYTVTVSAVAP